MAKAKSASPTKPAPNLPSMVVVDYDHKSINTEGVTQADRKGVREWSETEAVVVSGINGSLQQAKLIEKNWKERNQKEGKRVFHCPFCERSSREDFKTSKIAQAHIDKKHKNEKYVAQKVEKRPGAAYSPIEVVISPKRTLADFTGGNLHGPAGNHYANIAKTDVVQMGRRALKIADTSVKAASLIALPEGIALEKANRMTDDELIKLTQMAVNRGRRQLGRGCRRLCAEKGIVLAF